MNLPAIMGLPTSGAESPLLRAYRYLPQIAAALLVIAIAWQGVQLIWLLRGQGKNPAASNTVLQPPGPPPAPRVNISSLINAHLFGVAGAQNSDPNNAPPTQVNLVLTGLMAVTDPKKGYAIIGESPVAAKTVPVGKALPGGVTLYAVYADRVLLDRNGQIETLRLPRQTTFSAPAQPATAPPPNSGFVDNLRRIVQNNPTSLNEVIRFQPYLDHDVMKGIRVYPGRDRQLFAKLGLQPSDLVTSINGTPLDNRARVQEIFNTLSNTDQASVTVERGGQTQQLTLNLAQITLPQAAEPAATAPPPEGTPPAPPTRETP